MDESASETDRRRLLGLGTAAVAAVVLSPAAHRRTVPLPADEADGHHLTEHVRAAYARMRF